MRLLLHQLRYEQIIFWRSREAAVFVFLFPLLLFLRVKRSEAKAHVEISVE